jgi:hypothetical protein
VLGDDVILTRVRALAALRQLYPDLHFGDNYLERAAHMRTGPPYVMFKHKAVYTLGNLKKYVREGTQAPVAP